MKNDFVNYFSLYKELYGDEIYLNSIEKEQPLVGIMKHCDHNLKNIKIGDLVGFTPFSKYEFIRVTISRIFFSAM